MARYAYPSFDNLPEELAKEIRARVTPGRGNVWRMGPEAWPVHARLPLTYQPVPDIA